MAVFAAPSNSATISTLRTALVDEGTPLAKRFRVLFSLKHLATQPADASTAIEAIAAAFSSPSALLKHELAYCLGQTANHEAVPYLRRVLQDKEEDAMCRHEAAEALGALNDSGSVDLLRRMKDDRNEPVVVRETCDIALDRIQWTASTKARSEMLKKR